MAENPEISQEELEKNNGLDGSRLWILINHRVYDVTDFKHPGGREVLEDDHGEDRWEEFKSIHSKAAKDQLKEFEIGVLRSAEPKQAQAVENGSGYWSTVVPFAVLILSYLVVFKMDLFGVFNRI